MPDIPVLGPLQALYFTMKNRSRAKAFSTWAGKHGLQFAANGRAFTPPENVDDSEDASSFMEHGSRASGIFNGLCGGSKIQIAYPQFASNRFRGDWQTEKNICWGTWKGHTVITWDTVFYELQADSDVDWSEGEFSSVLVLTDTPLHRIQLTPNTIGNRLRATAIEEGAGLLSLHAVEFEPAAFNKAYRVKARDKGWTRAVIDQAMIKWMMESKKHTMEIAPGGIMVSTWFTLKPEQIEAELDFCTGFLERIPEELKHRALEETPA